MLGSPFCGDVVDGPKGQGHDCAGQADDVVGHREVGRGEAHQQRLGVQPQEAGAPGHLESVNNRPEMGRVVLKGKINHNTCNKIQGNLRLLLQRYEKKN